MCVVFPETEATSLMAQGVRPENIALGLHLFIPDEPDMTGAPGAALWAETLASG
jgi:activator of 2-hydroxyglutaryl-CoA dehydratase